MELWFLHWRRLVGHPVVQITFSNQPASLALPIRRKMSKAMRLGAQEKTELPAITQNELLLRLILLVRIV